LNILLSSCYSAQTAREVLTQDILANGSVVITNDKTFKPSDNRDIEKTLKCIDLDNLELNFQNIKSLMLHNNTIGIIEVGKDNEFTSFLQSHKH
jgi:hypothetical protein